MSPRLPVVEGDDLVRALQRAGFRLLRRVGSHHVMGHPDGRRTAVPVHAGKALKRGTLAGILRDLSWTAEELRRYL